MNLVLIFLLLTRNIYLINGQTSITPIILVQPGSCSSGYYYDISHLSCQQCPANSVASDSKFFKFILF